MNDSSKNIGHTPAKQRGISLIELMIGLALSLILAIGIGNLFVGSKQTYITGEGISRLQENARYVMSRIAEDLKAAGHMGCLPSAGNIKNVLSDPTANYDFRFPTAGLEGAAGTPDELTIRRAIGGNRITVLQGMERSSETDDVLLATGDIRIDPNDTDYARLEQWDVIAISNCSEGAVFMITNDPTTSNGLIQHTADVVAPLSSNNPGQSNTSVWLSQRAFDSDGFSSSASIFSTIGNTYTIDAGTASLLRNRDALIDGVEDMQIVYGIDTNGDQQAERYQPAPVADWDQVISVRISLTLNTVSDIVLANGDLDTMARTFTNTFRVRNRAP